MRRRYYNSSSCGRHSTASTSPALVLVSPHLHACGACCGRFKLPSRPRNAAAAATAAYQRSRRQQLVPLPGTLLLQGSSLGSCCSSDSHVPRRARMRKLNPSYKMEFRKKFPNHTEMAYREAVSKLKYLLAESYAPKIAITKPMITYNKRACKENVEEYADEIDTQSVTSDVSKKGKSYYPSRLSNFPVYPTSSAAGNERIALPPAELLSFIERQEDYIQQLERESNYCKDELKNLIEKVREVVAENEALQDKTKSGFFKTVLDTYSQNVNEDSKLATDFADDPGLRLARKSPGSGGGGTVRLLEGPSIVFESRISELEAQLTQARLELRKAREDSQDNLERLSRPGDPAAIGSQLELERALRDKRELEAKVEELQRELSKTRTARDSELETKAKRAMEAAQQAEFDKAQTEVEVRRLRDELERRQEKLREALQETNRRVLEEKHQVERRMSQQMEQLSQDAASHWEAASKSQLESEKQRREIADLRRELAQKVSYIDDLKREMQTKAAKIQEELNAAIADRDASQEEVSTTKLAAERNERQARQEQSRLQSEINSYKMRLERADADLVHARRENLRLKEEIAALEKEINMNRIIEETRVGVLPSSTSSTKQGDKVKEEKDTEKELASLIFDLESKQAKTVASLEDTLSKQASLVSRLTTECQSLTQRLEANDQKHKQEMASLQNNIEYLSSRMRESFDLGEQNIDDISQMTLDTDKTGLKEKNNNEITQDKYSLQQPRQKFENQMEPEITEEIHDANVPTGYPAQSVEEQNLHYTGAQENNYENVYANDYNQYNQYDPSQYQEFYNNQQYAAENQDYSQDQQQYPQNESYLPDQQYIEKENYKDETYNNNNNNNNGKNYENYSTKRDEKK